MHQQRLTAAGGTPVGQFIELWPGFAGLVEGRYLVGIRLIRVILCDLPVK